MKRRSVVVVVLLIGVVVCGVYAEPIGRTNAEVETAATTVIGHVIEAYNTNTFAKVAMHFAEEMFTSLPQDSYERMRAEAFEISGTIRSFEYLGFRTQPGFTVVFYRAESENGMLIIKLALSHQEDRTVVVGLWFE